MPLLIFGSLLSPINLTSYKTVTHARVLIDDQGIIEYIENYDPAISVEEAAQSFIDQNNLPSFEVICLRKGQFIIPGFIDTHAVRISS